MITAGAPALQQDSWGLATSFFCQSNSSPCTTLSLNSVSCCGFPGPLSPTWSTGLNLNQPQGSIWTSQPQACSCCISSTSLTFGGSISQGSCWPRASPGCCSSLVKGLTLVFCKSACDFKSSCKPTQNSLLSSVDRAVASKEQKNIKGH